MSQSKWYLVVLILAMVLFAVASLGIVPEPLRVRLIAAGLSLWVFAVAFLH
jgi:hypothetical protein